MQLVTYGIKASKKFILPKGTLNQVMYWTELLLLSLKLLTHTIIQNLFQIFSQLNIIGENKTNVRNWIENFPRRSKIPF